jgi:hypothetical protein
MIAPINPKTISQDSAEISNSAFGLIDTAHQECAATEAIRMSAAQHRGLPADRL